MCGQFRSQLADEMMNGAKNELNRALRNCPMNIEAYKETKEVAKDNASGLMYVKMKKRNYAETQLI